MKQLEMDALAPEKSSSRQEARVRKPAAAKIKKSTTKATRPVAAPCGKKGVYQTSKPINGHAAVVPKATKPRTSQQAPDATVRPKTKANLALEPQTLAADAFNSESLRQRAYYVDDDVLILNMHVNEGLELLASEGIFVNCIVTSPPFYGQRDYGVDRQIGLEEHPSAFVENLATVFAKCWPVLAPNGSLWINIGDTYWSGKGEHKSGEAKQNARRFGLRPQDRKGDGKWCVPKQLLLIPHRLAIALQDQGWIARNDNVWVKPNPIPDQVRDRCSISHEYVFHFVKERWYFFDKEPVGRLGDHGSILPPLDTWELPPVRGSAGHKARFSEELVKIPILSTTPKGGVVLDPFAGSGTSLVFARRHGFRAIGIDLKREFCDLMIKRLRK
jgi:site-specific DNA-methyltransferase (cytosine-N4-specific)